MNCNSLKIYCSLRFYQFATGLRYQWTRIVIWTISWWCANWTLVFWSGSFDARHIFVFVVLLIAASFCRAFLFPCLQVVDYVFMAERFGLIDRTIAPAILRIVWNFALFQQKHHTIQMTFGCGQMERCTSIVIAQRDIHAAQFVTTQRSHIATSGRKQQIDNRQTLRFVSMTSWILLVGRMLQIIVTMEIETVHQFFAELNTAATIAQWIQWRRPRKYSHDIWYDHQHATAYAGLRWQTHFERKLTGIIVHSARVHQRQYIAHNVRPKDFLLGYRTYSAIGQSGRNDRHGIAIRFHGTTLKVEIHTFAQIRLLRKAFIFSHIESERIVPIGRLTFREKYGIVETETFTARHSLQHLQRIIEFFRQRHLWFHKWLQQRAN